MNKKLRRELILIAAEKIKNNDPSHDLDHALRVLYLAEYIGKKEGGDRDIIVPSALFHDIICYPKNHRQSIKSTKKSATLVKKILAGIDGFPDKKIKAVKYVINSCSFTKGINPITLEAKIIQDADRLEATGAVAIMRTFSSTGSMNRKFYNQNDPFCENRKPDDMKYAIDLFYTRLLKVHKLMHTATAKRIAKLRTNFLKDFLKELKIELSVW